jgi:hypothetical protein
MSTPRRLRPSASGAEFGPRDQSQSGQCERTANPRADVCIVGLLVMWSGRCPHTREIDQDGRGTEVHITMATGWVDGRTSMDVGHETQLVKAAQLVTWVSSKPIAVHSESVPNTGATGLHITEWTGTPPASREGLSAGSLSGDLHDLEHRNSQAATYRRVI